MPSLSSALNCWHRASAAELPVSLRCEGLLHRLPSEEAVAVPELRLCYFLLNTGAKLLHLVVNINRRSGCPSNNWACW